MLSYYALWVRVNRVWCRDHFTLVLFKKGRLSLDIEHLSDTRQI